MSGEGHDRTHDDSMLESYEGAFDQQLSFPTPFIEAPQPIETVVKRDGREAPYEKSKIADAIFRAAQSIGGHDRNRAESLATGVTIYLSKVLNGRPPTVDQIHDAVEKVLIEMGHARTALAYARYRDRRARMRQLKAGNIRALLKELAEAEGEPAPTPAPVGASLFVRTSAEAVVEWDRARIVQALVRETDLEESVAEVIAREVEQQIVGAGVRTLTAALVRELVDAKLIEFGLEEHRRRHARLGVPLYDAERILCAPNGAVGEGGIDPEATNGVLAEHVKREYALAQVYSQAVADAHLRGDVHLQGLGAVDRLQGIAPALDFVVRFGSTPFHGVPPRSLDTLIWETSRLNAALLNHTWGWITWEALNVYLAPFASGVSDADLREIARMLLFLLMPAGPRPGRSAATVAVSLCFDVPPQLAKAEALGLGGAGLGRTYRQFAHGAQQWAWALLDAWQDAASQHTAPRVPKPVVRLTHEFWHTPGHERFLQSAAEAAVTGGVDFVLDRSVLPARDRARPWQPWWVAAHEVAINMPRLAYVASDEAGMYDALETALDTATRAHRDKLAFLHRLYALGEVGPLALLAARREGAVYAELDRAACLITPVGLHECVRHLTDHPMGEGGEAEALTQRLLEHIKTWCDRRGDRECLALVPAHVADDRLAARLAELDLRAYPEPARALLANGTARGEAAYASGAGLPDGLPISPMERVRVEGRLHDWLEAVSPTPVPTREIDMSPDTAADFIRKAFFQTASSRIEFVRP